MAGGEAAPDVAAADDDGNLHPESEDFLHLARDFLHDLGRNGFAAAAFAQRFPAQFQDDAFVGGLIHGGPKIDQKWKSWGGKTSKKLGRAHSPLAFELHFLEAKCALAGGDNQLVVRAGNCAGLASTPGDNRRAEDF